MSWDRAPLYVVVHDLCRHLDERSRSADRSVLRLLAPVRGHARRLLCAVASALTFPSRRSLHLRRADEAVVEVRVLLRLLRDAGGISPGGARALAQALDTAGRMLGGWRRAWERPRHRELAPVATTASSAAGRTGTTPGGAVPPTATGTTRTGPTTTLASGSPCRPPPARRSMIDL